MTKKRIDVLGLWKSGDRLDIHSGGETRNAVSLFPATTEGHPVADPQPFAPQSFPSRKALHKTFEQARQLAAAGKFIQFDIHDEFIGPTRYVLGNLKPAEKSSWVGRIRWMLDASSGNLKCRVRFSRRQTRNLWR